MENHLMQYMVDFTLPKELPDDFVHQIPAQRARVNRLMHDGVILNYALSLENSKLWVVFSVPSYEDLMEAVDMLPLTPYMKVKISELTFYNAAHPFIPAFSMN